MHKLLNGRTKEDAYKIELGPNAEAALRFCSIMLIKKADLFMRYSKAGHNWLPSRSSTTMAIVGHD